MLIPYRPASTTPPARFRIKKKMKTVNLERTVSDLTGRVDELEQEAADLRRENGWLKEIVMLKSRRPGPSFFAMPPSVVSRSGQGPEAALRSSLGSGDAAGAARENVREEEDGGVQGEGSSSQTL
jgi:hypothetical protein